MFCLLKHNAIDVVVFFTFIVKNNSTVQQVREQKSSCYVSFCFCVFRMRGVKKDEMRKMLIPGSQRFLFFSCKVSATTYNVLETYTYQEITN